MPASAKAAVKKPAVAIRPQSAREVTQAKNTLTTANLNFNKVFLSPPQDRIAVIKQGVPAMHVSVLAKRMNITKDALIATLRLSRATINRKTAAKKALSQDESERVLGIEYLIGQVENMIKQSGNPDGFDAARWISKWLNEPLPALGNQKPAGYMDTVEGQKLVSSLLAMAQSGAYA